MRSRRGPYWYLVLKELRLQQLSLVVALLFAVGWFGLGFVDRSRSAVDLDRLASGLSGFYVFVIVMLVGALAFAEERQLEMRAPQLLVPLAAWKQWVVKLVCAVAVLQVFAGWLPVFLAEVTPLPLGAFTPWPRAVLVLYLQGAAISALGFVVVLYVGSLSTGGLRAFLYAIVALVASGVVLSLVTVPLRWLLTWQASIDASWLGWVSVGRGTIASLYRWLPIACAAAVCGGLLKYAFENFRSLDQPSVLLRRQAPRLVALVVGLALLQYLVLGTLSAAMFYQFEQRRKAAAGASPPASSQIVPAPAR